MAGVCLYMMLTGKTPLSHLIEEEGEDEEEIYLGAVANKTALDGKYDYEKEMEVGPSASSFLVSVLLPSSFMSFVLVLSPAARGLCGDREATEEGVWYSMGLVGGLEGCKRGSVVSRGGEGSDVCGVCSGPDGAAARGGGVVPRHDPPYAPGMRQTRAYTCSHTSTYTL